MPFHYLEAFNYYHKTTNKSDSLLFEKNKNLEIKGIKK